MSVLEVRRAERLGEDKAFALVKHVLGKLGLRDRVQAVIFAYESGLTRPGSS